MQAGGRGEADWKCLMRVNIAKYLYVSNLHSIYLTGLLLLRQTR